MASTSQFLLLLSSFLIILFVIDFGKCEETGDYEYETETDRRDGFYCPTIGRTPAPAYRIHRRSSANDYPDYPDHLEPDYSESTTSTQSTAILFDDFDKKIQFEVETIDDDVLERAGGFRGISKGSIKSNSAFNYIILPEENKPIRNNRTTRGWPTASQSDMCGDLIFCSDDRECNAGSACCAIPGTKTLVCMKAIRWM